MTRQRRGRTIIALAALLVLAISGLVASNVGDAAMTTDAVPVPSDMVADFVEAAQSCPALTPARLAGQIMGASGFRADAEQGIALLSDEQWATWAPWSGATRQSNRASILALAHLTCDLVGHLRVAGVGGEAWHMAVAASQSSVSAVQKEAGVPTAVAAFVDRVDAYAAWYALQPDFGGLGSPSLTTPDAGTPLASATRSPSPSPQPSQPVLGTPSATPRPSSTQRVPEPLPTQRPVPAPTTAAPPPTVAPPSTVAPPAGAIVGPSGLCIDIPAQNTFDGNGLQLWTCNGTPAQLWTFRADGTIRGLQKCMDVAFSGTSNGTKVQLWGCDNTAAQQWVYNNGKLINPQSNKCLDAPGPDIGIGTQLQIWDCQSGRNQLWIVSGATTVAPPAGAIVGPSGLCIDIPAQNTFDGNGLQLWTCNGTPAQLWTFRADGTIRGLQKCMDVAFSGTSNGTKVQLWGCDNTAAQQWVYNNGKLINPQSNKCLDAPGPDIGIGIQLQIWDCEAGRNQMWTLT